MLNGITFYTDDEIWQGMLSDLGAACVPRCIADLVWEPDPAAAPVSPLELESKIMAWIDMSRKSAVQRVCGSDANLSPLLSKIITLLDRAGAAGIGAADLRLALGYSPDATSHALDTAIHTLRKTFGQGFIITENGKYKLKEHPN